MRGIVIAMESGGARAAYRKQLALLATTDLVEARIEEWAAAAGAGGGGAWRRTYGRLRPQRSPWAVLAYESEDGRTVRVVLHESAAPGSSEPLGRLEITHCDADPALPGLAEVLRRLIDPVVVRYRPGSRCTVRGGSDAGERFVKVVAGSPDDQVDARGLWDASRAGQVPFAVAEPHGCHVVTASSWYGVVPGRSLAPDLLGVDGAHAAGRVGAALGALAAAPLVPTRRAGSAEQLARTTGAVARAAATAPVLEAELARATEVLERAHHRLPERQLVPVHGAPRPHAWLIDGSGQLGLVDFDRYALGEPELDLATLLVELENETTRVVPMASIEDALVEGFADAGAPVDIARLALYQVHKRLANVTRTAISMRPDGDERAARRLAALDDDLMSLERV